VGLGFYGMGSATPLIGIHFDNVIYGLVRWCSFNNFADNAIKTDSDVIGCTFQQNYAINCLLDRTRAAKEGVLDVDGTDHRILEGEYTASVSALTDSNARCGAVVIRGGQHFVSNVVAEISDFGIATIGITSEIRVFNARADLNYGNGFEISDSTQMVNCDALRNGRETTNTYDGFSVTGVGNSFVSCRAVSLSADAWKHRYGFSDTLSSDSNKNYYDALCRSSQHATAAWNLSTSAGACHMAMTGPAKSFTNADTTPSVEDYGTFREVNSGATSITTFDDGFQGQEITVLATTVNTTFVNGATLITSTGANVVTAVNRLYRFKFINTAWHQF